MIPKNLAFVFFIAITMSGCASVSSSSVPEVALSEQTIGPIFITQTELPPEVEYEVIGQVKANARKGYDSVVTLYPLLAKEARKIGANAVIGVYGGRTVSAFSWASPYTGGMAVKVKNTDSLRSLEGKFF
ncbi:hypothetical protein MnBA_14880 [Marinobacterium sp. BA1]